MEHSAVFFNTSGAGSEENTQNTQVWASSNPTTIRITDTPALRPATCENDVAFILRGLKLRSIRSEYEANIDDKEKPDMVVWVVSAEQLERNESTQIQYLKKIGSVLRKQNTPFVIALSFMDKAKDINA